MTEEQAIPRKAIIVVEDNDHIGQLIKDTLDAEPDYQAVVVGDGAEALDVIRSVRASLVLLDLDLPGLSGLDVYDLLQADELLRNIPVIFVTANFQDPRFRERRITGIIPKPFDLNDLLHRVNEVCRSGG